MTDDDYANWSARGRAPADDERELRTALRAPAPSTRRDAALGLVDLAADADETGSGLADRTLSRLADRVRRDGDPEVRQFAVEALGVASADADAVEPALSDANEWVRAEAVVALARTGPSDARERLDAALADDSGFVRRNAVIALAKTGAADAETLRERLKEDPHAGVREYAAKFLATFTGETEETVTVLAAVLARDPEAFVRAGAATALGKLGTDRAEEALESQGLSDRSEDVVRAARRALATARGTDPEDVELPPTAPGGGPDRPEETPGGRPDGVGAPGGPPSKSAHSGPGPGPGPGGGLGSRDRNGSGPGGSPSDRDGPRR
ncbi:HEAT repeat domain-containing protein (plasmid) [Halobaculum sp. CBA1158]|uniref:HEAT repeat domain-containing protein n=1 Tax=Halobaculum sp. CBA1158 TaxID=2904243 RepID=UPI001F22AF98|nr:HEAT repeat domain-containing protein [Halobaculum sp. CBA1158]UIP01436.1 HEAT repeat domain-containing protein [Halobaculum sp. CBA1158]